MLPLPYVPEQWIAPRDSQKSLTSDAPKASVANAISMTKVVDKTTAEVGDTVTWTLTADNLTASGSDVLTLTTRF